MTTPLPPSFQKHLLGSLYTSENSSSNTLKEERPVTTSVIGYVGMGHQSPPRPSRDTERVVSLLDEAFGIVYRMRPGMSRDMVLDHLEEAGLLMREFND